MELHAAHSIAAVFQGHDMAIRIGSHHMKFWWKIFLAHHPRMVAAAKELWWAMPENAFLLVDHGNSLAMVYLFEVMQCAAVKLANGLHAEANAKYGFRGMVAGQHCGHDPRIFWQSRAGRKDDAVILLNSVQGNVIVPVHINPQAGDLFHEVNQVIGKAIVIIQ